MKTLQLPDSLDHNWRRWMKVVSPNWTNCRSQLRMNWDGRENWKENVMAQIFSQSYFCTAHHNVQVDREERFSVQDGRESCVWSRILHHLDLNNWCKQKFRLLRWWLWCECGHFPCTLVLLHDCKNPSRMRVLRWSAEKIRNSFANVRRLSNANKLQDSWTFRARWTLQAIAWLWWFLWIEFFAALRQTFGE